MRHAAGGPQSEEEWNGLRQIERTLPSTAYFDPAHYELELQKIFYRQWIYLCRSDAIAEPLAYRTFEIGSQPIVVLRDESGTLRAFLNTCRHRGSLLCQGAEGKLRAKSITCPYHSWTYDLRGDLKRIPTHERGALLRLQDFPLYQVALQEWNGFVFANLSAQEPTDFRAAFDPSIDRLQHWPLADLLVGHTRSATIHCNWKVFWENYNECLHCPNIHPALSKLVPIYGRAIMDPRDDPRWREHADKDEPQYRRGVRPGAATWSTNGQTTGHTFPELSDAQRRVGYQFVTVLPSMFVVGHVDYVRAVRLRPLGPELTELQAQWLYPREALSDPNADLSNSIDFSWGVIAEDGAVCELAQRGMHSMRHTSGVLLPEEYELKRLHDWIRGEMVRP